MEVDKSFLQPIEVRLKPAITEADGIPTIDLSSVMFLDHLSNTENIDGLIAEIGDACEKWGFFQIVNHGIPQAKLEKLKLTAQKFFALPKEEKKKVSKDALNSTGYTDNDITANVRDWKEIFDFAVKEPTLVLVSPDDPEPKQIFSRWPEYPSEFRDEAKEFAGQIEKVTYKVLELIALSLGLAPSRFHGFFKDSTNIFRLNNYMSCPSPDLVLGVGAHKDQSCLSVIAQDDVGGLQVRRKSDGEWVSVKPITGAFVVNVGDLIQVWSNDKYESVEHRVIVNTQKPRFSISFGLYPSHYTMVKPLEEFVDDKSYVKYKEFHWGAYFARKRKGLPSVPLHTVNNEKLDN